MDVPICARHKLVAAGGSVGALLLPHGAQLHLQVGPFPTFHDLAGDLSLTGIPRIVLCLDEKQFCSIKGYPGPVDVSGHSPASGNLAT